MKKTTLTKKIISTVLVTAVCSLITTVYAERVDYKKIYSDFLEDIFAHRDFYASAIQISDLDLDGIPELIIYDGGAVAAHGVNIFQLISEQPELRYGMYYRDNDYFNENYFEDLNIPMTSNYYDSDDLVLCLKNGIPMYILRSHNSDGGTSWVQYYTFKNVDEKIKAIHMAEKNIFSSDDGEIISMLYKLKENECTQDEFDLFFKEYTKANFKPSYMICENISISEIKDFIDGYVPELKVLGSAYVYVNGNKIEFDSMPIIKDGRTLVPIRAICEEMGADVVWDEESQTATISKGFNTLKIQIGNTTMYKNDTAINLDVPAEILYNRTIVPVRAISEGLGAEIIWDGSNNIIDILY